MKNKTRLWKICGMIFMIVLAIAVVVPLHTALATGEPVDEPEPLTPSLEIQYKNLSYSDSTYVIFAVRYQNFDPDANTIRMLFWSAPQDNYTLSSGNITHRASAEWVQREINGTYYKIVYSKGIAPKELIDVIYCRAYAVVNGETVYSPVVKYSPLTYLKNVVQSDAAPAVDKALASSLIAYSAAAQTKFNHEPSDLTSDTHYYVTLTNGVFAADGFTYGLYKENAVQTVNAVVPDGETFVRWMDNSGRVLGTNTTLALTVDRDMAVRAVFESDPDSCDHVYGSWIEAVDPTCTETGSVGHYHCSVCGRDFDGDHAVIDDVTVPALGHDWVNVPAQAPTCVPGWNAYRRCSRCELTEDYVELPAVDEHDYVDNVVAPVGETRGYTEHTCSVCGDSYITDIDYSLYSGVNFSTAGKYMLPQNYDSSAYTFEAAVQLNPGSGRAGVIVGNYDGKSACINIEVYTGGQVRLYFKAVENNKIVTHDYYFNSVDIRSADVKNLAVTVQRGEACLYVDGVLRQTKTLDDFDIPHFGRTMVLGGDNRAGNTQGFIGTVYSFTVYRDIRTQEELINDMVSADTSDQNWICTYNLLDDSSLNNAVVLENVQESAQVTTVEELAYHASHGTRNIEVMNDITIDRTIYAISGVTIFANGDYSLIRDPDFYGDLFVVGENAAGRNLILDNIVCALTLGKAGAAGTLTIDGNKENVTGDVFGALVYINCSGTLNINDGAVLTNNMKTANSRTLGLTQYYANQVGGAAIVNINGTVNMNGGVISNNEVNFNDPSGGDNTAENYLQSCYGGAVFNASNFVMNGGTISGNSAYYGGAIANYLECDVYGGVIENNYTSHAGGAIYMVNLTTAVLVVGDEDGDPSDVIFRGNHTTSAGGAIYGGTGCSTIIYGGATFNGNYASGNGGAVYMGNLGWVGPNTVFSNNYSTGANGGALYITADVNDIRTSRIEGATFTGNSARSGGAIALVGTNTTIVDCIATNNHANVSGGAIFVNRNGNNVGAIVSITGGSFSENTATGEAGALFADLNCTVTLNGTSLSENEAGSNGGAISLHGVTGLTLTGATISENRATASGGAIYASYRTVTDNTDPENPVDTRIESSVTIQNCTFTSNHTDVMGGAAMGISYANGVTVMTVSGTTFTSNSAGSHGGALTFTNCTGSLSNNTFTSNTAFSNGGAIYCNGGGAITGSGNSFASNSVTDSTYGGGALYFTHGTGTLTGSTFTGNTSNQNAGAVAVYSASNVTLTNTTATGNTAANSGGFAFVSGSNSVLTMNVTGANRNVIGSLTNSALGNTAASGAAIFTDGAATLALASADVGYNSTTGSGGAFYFNGASGTITNSTISHNLGGSAGGDSYGGAMMVGYGSNVTLTNCDFTGNSSTTWAGAIYIRHKDASGGNPAVPSTVTATGTSFTSNSSGIGGAVYVREYCTFTGTNCTFTTNSSTSGNGGAIFVAGSGTADLTGGTLLQNTSASSGGAIYANSSAAVSLNGTTLQQNTSVTSGGAVFVNTGATLTATNDTLFDRNSSTGIGGAIYSNSGSSDLTDTDFTGNTVGASGWYGGAIYTNGTSALTVDSCEFTGNSNPTGSGGAITVRGTGTLTITDSTFTENTAKTHGGAIQVFETVTATITDSDFIDNTGTTSALKGGAIAVGHISNNVIAAAGTLTVSGGTFSGNSASTGGAIHVYADATHVSTLNVTGSVFTENSSTGNGGAICADAYAVINLSGVTLEDNTAAASAGAVYLSSNSALTTTKNGNTNTLFDGNTCTGSGSSGGAIYCNGASIDMSDTDFAGNSAASGTYYGGAIYANGASVLTADGCSFTGNNILGAAGGAICIRGTGSLTVSDSAFSGNISKTQGGAILAFETVTVDISDTTFTDNRSNNSNGGAIAAGKAASDATALILDGCTFTSNQASGSGGAIYLYGTGSLTATDTDFITNTAGSTGGAIYSYLDGTNVSLTDCELRGNTATGNGGAIYHSAGTNMTWTRVTAKDNASSARGDAVYVTNGSGKTTYFTIYSATFDQPSRACIDIGNSSAYVTVTSAGVTDVNHSPVNFSQIITGTLSKVSYV